MPLKCSSRNWQFPQRVPFIKEKMPWCPCPFKNEAYMPVWSSCCTSKIIQWWVFVPPWDREDMQAPSYRCLQVPALKLASVPFWTLCDDPERGGTYASNWVEGRGMGVTPPSFTLSHSTLASNRINTLPFWLVMFCVYFSLQTPRDLFF